MRKLLNARGILIVLSIVLICVCIEDGRLIDKNAHRKVYVTTDSTGVFLSVDGLHWFKLDSSFIDSSNLFDFDTSHAKLQPDDSARFSFVDTVLSDSTEWCWTAVRPGKSESIDNDGLLHVYGADTARYVLYGPHWLKAVIDTAHTALTINATGLMQATPKKVRQ